MLAVYRYSLCLVLTGCLLALGCSAARDLGKTLGDLAKVRAELMNKFGEADVNVRVNTFRNQTSLLVMYVNSPLNQKTPEERAKRAQETAEITRRLYPGIKNISEIWVGFTRVTTRMVIFHSSEMVDARGFDNEARALRDPGMAPLDPSHPEVRYSASQNQTEISSSSIQLEGTTERGVILVAHFAVAGNVDKVTPKPPAEVSLDFAAFSDKPKFPNLTKLVFLSDNKIVYQTGGQFSTSKIAGETYCEFLYLKMPTAMFLKLASGAGIKLKLNEHEYTLTDNQVQQLQRMSDYCK